MNSLTYTSADEVGNRINGKTPRVSYKSTF